jgi:hypothetical protein
MTQSSLGLNEQIELVEKRVQLDKLQLKAGVQGLRSSLRHIVSGRTGMGAIFLIAAVVGTLGGRKLTSRRR